MAPAILERGLGSRLPQNFTLEVPSLPWFSKSELQTPTPQSRIVAETLSYIHVSKLRSVAVWSLAVSFLG